MRRTFVAIISLIWFVGCEAEHQPWPPPEKDLTSWSVLLADGRVNSIVLFCFEPPGKRGTWQCERRRVGSFDTHDQCEYFNAKVYIWSSNPVRWFTHRSCWSLPEHLVVMAKQEQKRHLLATGTGAPQR